MAIICKPSPICCRVTAVSLNHVMNLWRQVACESIRVLLTKLQGNQFLQLLAIGCLMQKKNKKFNAITRHPPIFPTCKEAAVLFLLQCDWAIRDNTVWSALVNLCFSLFSIFFFCFFLLLLLSLPVGLSWKHAHTLRHAHSACQSQHWRKFSAARSICHTECVWFMRPCRHPLASVSFCFTPLVLSSRLFAFSSPSLCSPSLLPSLTPSSAVIRCKMKWAAADHENMTEEQQIFTVAVKRSLGGKSRWHHTAARAAHEVW